MSKSLRRNAPLIASIAGLAVFSTGCTIDDVLTIAKIVALFI
ncbi:MAG TPA: hypothetical protein PLP95_08640 [Microthrixaceae bacterium]|nr:hypothetical protein [Microthrixaceae bacterium]